MHYVRKLLEKHRAPSVMRSGQPDQAPNDSFIRRYAINDYKEETDLTLQKSCAPYRKADYGRMAIFTSSNTCAMGWRVCSWPHRQRRWQAALSDKCYRIGQDGPAIAGDVHPECCHHL